jgi:hypothetical protein
MSLSKKILPNMKMMTMTVLTIAIGSFLLTGVIFLTPSHSAYAIMPNQNMIGNTGGFGHGMNNGFGHWGFGHGMNNGFGHWGFGHGMNNGFGHWGFGHGMNNGFGNNQGW